MINKILPLLQTPTALIVLHGVVYYRDRDFFSDENRQAIFQRGPGYRIEGTFWSPVPHCPIRSHNYGRLCLHVMVVLSTAHSIYADISYKRFIYYDKN